MAPTMDRQIPFSPHAQSLRDREQRLSTVLKAARPSLRLAMLFGSFAEGRERFGSDVDVALLDREPLDMDTVLDITEAVGDVVGRHVDIVDLNQIPVPITGIALRGTRLFGTNECYASLCTRYLIEHEDFGRLRERLMDKRIEAWIR